MEVSKRCSEAVAKAGRSLKPELTNLSDHVQEHEVHS